MCRNCVTEGRMTQKELDTGIASGDDITALLRRMMAGDNEDADTKAKRQMDDAVKAIQDLVKDAVYKGAPTGPDELSAVCQSVAGQLMFSSSPAAIAYLAAILADRLNTATMATTPPLAKGGIRPPGGMYI